MRVLHVCNGMREYDFFFTFSSFPSLFSPAFLLRPFLSLLELADGLAERIAVDSLVSHPSRDSFPLPN